MDTVARITRQRENLSYKFQRLRERIRQAIASGELSGKLPGEREMARRFHANPKTLGKALTDLAAEGLLDRSIGRGTYVRGSQAPTSAGRGKWLILCDADDQNSPLATRIIAEHPHSEVVTCGTNLRPSFLSQFAAVIDLSPSACEPLLRGLLVRGIPVVVLGRDPLPHRLHAVLLDRAEAAWRLTRGLALGGHRSILIIEPAGDHTASSAACIAAQRYAPGTRISACSLDDVPCLDAFSHSAVLCDGVSIAQRVQQHAQLGRLALAAIGVCEGQPPCSGIFIRPAQMIEAATPLLREEANHRPLTLWLAGEYADRGTTWALPEPRVEWTSPIPAALSA